MTVGILFAAVAAIDTLLIAALLIRELAKNGALNTPIHRISRMWETATDPKLIETVSVGVVITGLGTATLFARSLYDVVSGVLGILIGLYMASVIQEKKETK